MGDSSFISDFHNIEGVTVGERKKKLQKLLKNKLFTADEAQAVLDSLKPKTYLERVFCVDILIYLKKTDQLLKILMHGNEIFVKKIMKEQWFFEEAFSTVSAKDIVNDLLPFTSFSVKMKLLKKLSIVLPEDKVNEIFDLVLKRYGLSIAVTVIPGCSPQKIEEILKSNEIKLWTYQLKIIHSKQPDLVTVYLNQHKHQQPETILEKSFLTYLAQRDPTLFWDLIEKFDFKIDLKLGRRTTKKLIVPKKHEIISKPKEYIKYFRHETLVRNLNKQGDFKDLYRNLFPKYTEILDQEDPLCNELLKYYPKRDQYRLFTQTFTEVIQESIWSNTSCLKDHFIDLIDDKEIRLKWAELKYKESNNDEYMKYYETEQCFNLIKEKINVTSSITERRNLLCILVKCCALNKDLKSLEKVLKYFCERHRNDDPTTRSKLLTTVHANFKVEAFNNTHWKYLHEIFTIQSLNKEYTNYNSYLRIKYIDYLYKNNGPCEEKNYAVLEYIKDETLAHNMRLDKLNVLKNAEIEKEIIQKAIEHLPKILKNQNMEYEKIYIQSQLIAQILSYNLRHKDYQFDVSTNESLIKILRESFQADHASYAYFQLFGKIVCKLNRNDFENEILKYYWEKTLQQVIDTDKILKWFLKYDPLVIVEYFDEIMKAYPQVLAKIWTRIKAYTHINLDNMVLKHYLKQLNDDKYEDKTTLVPPLSFLSTSEDYIRIMEEHHFIPTSSKLVIDSQEEKDIYKVQRIVVKNFKNIKEPLKFVPILIDKFCQGDYLKASLTSLYSSFHRCPENELKIYLDKLSNNNAISVKKHSLFLACSVFDQQMVLQILKRFGNNEKNASLQKCTFLSSLKYFSKNPNEEFYEQVLFLMGLLKASDIESLKILSTIRISKNYKHFYIESIWKLLEALKTNAKEAEAGRFSILMSSVLDSIDTECIQKLPHDFCKEIIQNNFLTNIEPHQSTSILTFVTKFLINRNENSINFDFVFKLLSDYKSQFWNISKRMALKSVDNFFKEFYSECYEKEINSDIIAQFSHRWENIFTPIETFEEYVLLNLLQIKKDAEPEQEMYSKHIVLFSEKIEAEFGQIVFPKFITILAKFLDIKRQELSNLLFNMLKCKTSVLNCILIIQLIILKDDLFHKDKIKQKYREIDSILKEITDPNVQLYYNLYLKSSS